jgi:phosphate:Na+ symporter
MEYGFFDLLRLLGALGLFLFGMKLMSESLQKVAGTRMRSILSTMTSNKFMGIFTGFLITAIIQSSSATTVMVVSFVNAGLLSLAESIGVIMGANIGTTVTAWLISIFGFKIDIFSITFILIGLGLPILFSKDKRRSSWGEVIIGFSLIFLGLHYLKEYTPDINSNPELLGFLSRYTSTGFISVLIFILIGTVLTMIIQSSSAVMALTLVMCYNGWISFDMAAAMVLGQNIGTTITANLAALIANSSAKRAARAHLVFNITGVILLLLVFNPFLRSLNWFIIKIGLTSPYEVTGQTAVQTAQAMPVALSIFHTVFNVANTLVLIWGIPFLIKIVRVMVPDRDEDEDFSLKYINTGLLSTGELSILQARKEMQLYAAHVTKMFEFVKESYKTGTGKKYNKFLAKIRKYEEVSDRMEVEIASYLTRITEESFSSSSSEKVTSMLNMASNIESIADSTNKLADTIERMNASKAGFTKEMDKNINRLFILIDQILKEMNEGFAREGFLLFPGKNKTFRKELLNVERALKEEHFKNLRKNRYKCSIGIIYSDMYDEVINLGNYALNVYDLLV